MLSDHLTIQPFYYHRVGGNGSYRAVHFFTTTTVKDKWYLKDQWW